MNLDVALCESIVRICGVPADQVTSASTLADLGIDSLTAAEIITDVEIRAQPDPEEVVGQVVVMHDRARRGAHRGQPVGAGHGRYTGG